MALAWGGEVPDVAGGEEGVRAEEVADAAPVRPQRQGGVEVEAGSFANQCGSAGVGNTSCAGGGCLRHKRRLIVLTTDMTRAKIYLFTRWPRFPPRSVQYVRFLWKP